MNKPLTDIADATQQEKCLAEARQLIAGDRAASDRFLKGLNRRGIDQLVTLFDNQPQLAFTATLHEQNVLAGPQEMAYTLEFQVGRRNLNTYRKQCGSDFTHCIGRALQAAKDSGDDFSDKFVLSASYKDVDRYRVTLDDVGAVADFSPIDLPRHRELSAKLQWGRKLKMMVADQHPRIDVNAEGIRITDGASDRKKNDWIGTATLTLPVMKNMSVPISLKYGNRRELLGEVDDELSAHFGISYRLPWDMNAQ